MKAVIQRVSRAAVRVESETISEIGEGVIVLLGVARGDTEQDAHYLARKTAHLRIFEDPVGKMNRSLLDIGGEALVVSQFTLCADCSKGRRPSFVGAAEPEVGESLYAVFGASLSALGVRVAWGRFGTGMDVEIHNHGPVTLVLDASGR